MDIATERAPRKEHITQDVSEGIKELKAKRPTNPFSASCLHITKVKRIPLDKALSKSATMLTKVRFAFVSFKKNSDDDFKDDSIFKSKPKGRGIDKDSCYRKLLRCNDQQVGEHWSLYQNVLRDALEKYKANIVCINELGIPANSNGPLDQFFDRAKYWAETKKAVIIAGSCHDPRTKYNTGYIFIPNCPPDGYAFHKQVSATTVGEYISVPPERHSIIVPAFGLRIGVITCLDLLDYSTIATLTQVRDAIDFILVPSCSRDVEGLGKVAIISSQAMPGGVAIVNYDRGRKHSSSMHLFGRKASEEPVLSEKINKNFGRISIYEVDLPSFGNKKYDLQDIEENLDWLFRFPSIDTA